MEEALEALAEAFVTPTLTLSNASTAEAREESGAEASGAEASGAGAAEAAWESARRRRGRQRQPMVNEVARWEVSK